MPEETTETSPSATTTPPPEAGADDNGTQTEESPCRNILKAILLRLRHLFMVLTYPLIVLFTIVSLMVIIFFCVFPTLLCMTLGICIYYCLMEDPIPLSVLLRYMLSPDAEDAAYPNLYPLSQQRPVIQAKLIVRKLLKIDNLAVLGDNQIDNHNHNSNPNFNPNPNPNPAKKEYPRKHPFAIEISTDHKCLHFSEPLIVMEEADTTTNNNQDEGKEEHGSSTESSIALPPYRPGDASSQTPSQPEEPTTNTLANEPPSSSTGDESIVTNTEIPTGSAEEGKEDSGSNDKDSDSDSDLVKIAIGRKNKPSAIEKGVVSCEEDCNVVVQENENDNDNDNDGGDDDEKAKSLSLEQEAEDYFGISDLRDRGTACDICLLEYQVGEDVAWSPNLECTHAFHKECILDWLVRKPTCPNCRHDYLKSKQDEEV